MTSIGLALYGRTAKPPTLKSSTIINKEKRSDNEAPTPWRNDYGGVSGSPGHERKRPGQGTRRRRRAPQRNRPRPARCYGRHRAAVGALLRHHAGTLDQPADV